MHQPYNEAYEKAQAEYEKAFGDGFPGYAYTPEAGMKIIQTCLKAGKPYDFSSDPNYDPDADY